MNTQSLKPGWKMVKFGDVVMNANLVERDPVANGVDRIVGLEHIDPENLHIRRWNSVADGTSFSRKFIPGQTLFGKRRAYQRKVAYAEFEGICSGDILTFETQDNKMLLPELLPFICQSEAFFDHALGTSSGSLSPRTSWTALKDFEFPLPPLDEQKRIIKILWAADEVVERNFLLKNAFRAFYISSIETFCFDKRYNAVKIEKIADINKETLSVLKTAKNYQFEYLDIGSVLAPKEIGKLSIYNFSNAPSRARRVVRDFDILISTVRPNLQSFIRIGKVDREIIASTGFAIISPVDYAIGSIVYHSFFSKRFLQYCNAKVTGTSYPAITAKDIGTFRIFIPSERKEIQRIAKILDSIDQSIRHIESCICAGKEMNQFLIDDLIGRGAPHV